MGAKYTEAQKKATLKYMEENLSHITMTVPKADKMRWKEEAAKRGLNLSQFIRKALEAEIERG